MLPGQDIWHIQGGHSPKLSGAASPGHGPSDTAQPLCHPRQVMIMGPVQSPATLPNKGPYCANLSLPCPLSLSLCVSIFLSLCFSLSHTHTRYPTLYLSSLLPSLSLIPLSLCFSLPFCFSLSASVSLLSPLHLQAMNLDQGQRWHFLSVLETWPRL